MSGLAAPGRVSVGRDLKGCRPPVAGRWVRQRPLKGTGGRGFWCGCIVLRQRGKGGGGGGGGLTENRVGEPFHLQHLRSVTPVGGPAEAPHQVVAVENAKGLRGRLSRHERRECRNPKRSHCSAAWVWTAEMGDTAESVVSDGGCICSHNRNPLPVWVGAGRSKEKEKWCSKKIKISTLPSMGSAIHGSL